VSTEDQTVWRLETKTDIDGVSTYQAWTDEPTDAVRKAADVLFAADSTDAVCYGWVPQARDALTAALDVVDLGSVAEKAIRDHAREQLDMAVGEYVEAKIRAEILGVTR